MNNGLNIYKTYVMIAAIQQLVTRRTFLRDRYFQTSSMDIFPTDEVLVEVKKGRKKLAPVVAPRSGGVTVLREGYKVTSYAPPKIAPKRPLTIDDLNKKQFGETLLVGGYTPEQREALILGQDLTEMSNMISSTEEYMCAQLMLNNAIVLKEKDGDKEASEYEIRFFDGSDNPAKYSPAVSWDKDGAKIYADIRAMVRMLSQNGNPAVDLVMAPDIADHIINDEIIQKLLDIKNINIALFEPLQLPDGTSQIGTINVDGHNINLISYDETYEDDEGNIKQFIPAGHVILTAPEAGKIAYGAVTQLEQTDHAFHTYVAQRVPKYFADAESEIRELKVTSRPLPMPNAYMPWVSAKVVF